MIPLILLAASLGASLDEDVTIGSAVSSGDGFLVHEVKSPYQSGTTQVRVLLPEKLDADNRHSVVYVLPVETGNENRYGDGLREIKDQGLHKKHEAIFVAPTFSHLPWYADHPTDPKIRQETYFLKVVVPLIEKTYPASAEPKGRLLLGFSKSGWGAWSLALRHPAVFGRAAAWDAPLMMESLGQYGTSEIFGTQENFKDYQIRGLLRAKAESLGGQRRLILSGYGSFRGHHQETHDLMNQLKVPHKYTDGTQRKHHWHSGWVTQAVESLLEM